MTRTPLRISLAGGGTDLADFYEHGYGQVLSTAIDKYVYVTVKRHSELFYEPIRINYSRTEQVNGIEEIENGIARECLKLLAIEPPIYLSVVGDMPASTGLGGSSSFAVGLLHALHALRGERVSAGQLAEEASYIEIDVLKEPIGKQDQYAAAFGGLNAFRFEPGGRVTVEPQRIAAHELAAFFDHTLLLWTGMQRDASSVLEEQRRNTQEKLDTLRQIRDHAEQLRLLVSKGELDPVVVGRTLHETWQRKRELASSISTDRIDRWYDDAMAAGAEGGKLCGAGGGGFLLLFVRPHNRQRVRNALSDLVEVRVKPEVQGSTVVLPFLR
jgi:D-glycero-alpha-D-manno-heptose-7-phosphate kinase